MQYVLGGVCRHFSEYSFPFFTSTISVGRGCNLIAQHKTELWESHLLSELTFQQKCYSVEPAIIASEETDIARKRLDLHVLVNHVSRCLAVVPSSKITVHKMCYRGIKFEVVNIWSDYCCSSLQMGTEQQQRLSQFCTLKNKQTGFSVYTKDDDS